MSFQFMPIYTGDYHRDTRHLTTEEHGAYFLLLIHCWDQKGPVPLDERRQCGIVNARSGGEIESLRRVLNEFFVQMADGWYNKRMMEEVAKAEHISSSRRRGGLEKARRMRDAVRHAHAVLEQNISNASAGTPTPTPTKEKSKEKDTSPSAPENVSQKVWRDWLVIRKAKKAPVTETVIDGIRREAHKANLSLEAALQISAENNWSGFKASWLEKIPATADAPWKGAINL